MSLRDEIEKRAFDIGSSCIEGNETLVVHLSDILSTLDKHKVPDCSTCKRPDLSEEEIRHIIAHLSYVRLESIHDVTNERIDVRRNVCPECTQVEAKLTKALKPKRKGMSWPETIDFCKLMER